MKFANECVLYINGSCMTQCEMKVIHGDPMFQRRDL